MTLNTLSGFSAQQTITMITKQLVAWKEWMNGLEINEWKEVEYVARVEFVSVCVLRE